MAHAWIEGIAILPLACLALACNAPGTTVGEGERAEAVSDHTVRFFPAGNHMLWEAATGTMREMPSLKRFVPGYADAVREWVLKRTR